MPVMQLVMQIVEWALGPPIIDKEPERSCVERSGEYWQLRPLQTRPPERKVRQQVEQRKQKKAQNWRWRSMRWSHVSDDDSPATLLSVGELRLTVTVCPQCTAVCRSDVMECHDTMSIHVKECHEEVVISQADSTGNGRCA